MAETSAAVRGLYAIADTSVLDDAALGGAVAAALRGGARIVQYRDKRGGAERRHGQAARLNALCRRHGALFLVNDDPQLAGEAGAHGVHLGRDDPDPVAARGLLGKDAVIGVSCYNRLELALAAQNAGADYIAFGSFFPSAVKPQAVRADLALLARARRRLGVPVVAIGGITPDNGAALLAAGADALAVVTGLFAAGDPETAARRYARLFAPAAGDAASL